MSFPHRPQRVRRAHDAASHGIPGRWRCAGPPATPSRSVAFGLSGVAAAAALLAWTCPSPADVLVVLADGQKVRADSLYVDAAAGILTARSERHGIRMERRLDPARVVVVMDGARVLYSAARGSKSAGVPSRGALPATAPSVAGTSTTGKRSGADAPSAALGRVDAGPPAGNSATIPGPAVHGIPAANHANPDRRGRPPVAPQSVGWGPGHRLVVPGLSSRSIIVGERGDPLTAYDDLVRTYYPRGIPPRERGIVLQTLRNVRLNQMLADSLSSAGFDLPLLPAPDAFLEPTVPPASATARPPGRPRTRSASSRSPRGPTPPVVIFYQRPGRSVEHSDTQ